MENNEVFEAETEIEAGRRAKITRKDARNAKPSQLGEVSATLAQHTTGRALEHATDEIEPLLARPDGDDGRRGSRAEDNGPDWAGKRDFAGLPWYKTPSIYWLLPAFALTALAFGGIIVPKLNLILELICKEYMADQSLKDPNFTITPVVFGVENPQCRQIPEVQSRVAQFSLYGNLISGILSAIVSPKLGALSDRYGRKRMMAIGTCGLLGGEIITIIAARNPDTFPVNWILVGFAIDGLCGSFTTGMALAHSYATDCTPPQRRHIAFGYFHGCLFTGVALGPILAGYIIKWTGSVLTIFYTALGFHLFYICFLVVIVPESLSHTRQMAAREKYALEGDASGYGSDWINAVRQFNLFEPLRILWPKIQHSDGLVARSQQAGRRNLLLLASVDTIVFGVAMGSMTIVVYYSEYQFGWGNLESSIFMSVVNICRVTCLIIILPIVTRVVRGKNSANRRPAFGADSFDLYVIRIAVFFDTLGYLGYTVVRYDKLFLLSGAIASVGGMGSPTLQSTLTKHVPPEKTGQLLGATGLLHALARVVAPTVFTGIYSATVGKFTQTVFVCLTTLFGVAFCLTWFVRPHVYLPEPQPEANDSSSHDEQSARQTSS